MGRLGLVPCSFGKRVLGAEAQCGIFTKLPQILDLDVAQIHGCGIEKQNGKRVSGHRRPSLTLFAHPSK